MVCRGRRYARLWPMHESRDIRKNVLIYTTHSRDHPGRVVHNPYPQHPPYYNKPNPARVEITRYRRLNDPSGSARMVNCGRMTSKLKYIIYKKVTRNIDDDLLPRPKRSKMNVTVYQHNKDFIFLTAPQKGITWCEHDLSNVVVSDDLGSFKLQGANVEEFDYHLDIVHVTDSGHIED
ncbi:hypothetical protein QTP88_022374 [Uroleucon formosanum]